MAILNRPKSELLPLLGKNYANRLLYSTRDDQFAREPPYRREESIIYQKVGNLVLEKYLELNLYYQVSFDQGMFRVRSDRFTNGNLITHLLFSRLRRVYLNRARTVGYRFKTAPESSLLEYINRKEHQKLSQLDQGSEIVITPSIRFDFFRGLLLQILTRMRLLKDRFDLSIERTTLEDLQIESRVSGEPVKLKEVIFNQLDWARMKYYSSGKIYHFYPENEVNQELILRPITLPGDYSPQYYQLQSYSSFRSGHHRNFQPHPEDWDAVLLLISLLSVPVIYREVISRPSLDQALIGDNFHWEDQKRIRAFLKKSTQRDHFSDYRKTLEALKEVRWKVGVIDRVLEYLKSF